VIPTSEAEVIHFSKLLSFSKEFHLDLVDGKFVPATSWPYLPAGEALNVKPYLDFYTLEIDLMVEEPIRAAHEWIIAGADMLVFHLETISLESFKAFNDATDVSIGISAHGETDLNTLAKYAEHADYIQLMGIKKIGAQSQPFDEAVIGKIIQLKKRFPYKSITVDGSVNLETIQKLKAAGADRFICGSAIVKQANPEAAQLELSSLIN
jgi:ribulose-phosphate 3-epimerase